MASGITGKENATPDVRIPTRHIACKKVAGIRVGILQHYLENDWDKGVSS